MGGAVAEVAQEPERPPAQPQDGQHQVAALRLTVMLEAGGADAYTSQAIPGSAPVQVSLHLPGIITLVKHLVPASAARIERGERVERRAFLFGFCRRTRPRTPMTSHQHQPLQPRLPAARVS